MENLLSAIDQHPVYPIVAPPLTLTSEMVNFESKSDAKQVGDVGEDRDGFDRVH